MEQIDWIALDDQRSAARRLLEQSANRIGIAELSHWLGEDESTVRNQLAYRDRRRPSAELEHLCWLLDGEYRRLKANLKGEVLSKPPDLTPEQALREIAVRAQAEWGRCAATDVAGVLARTRMGEKP